LSSKILRRLISAGIQAGKQIQSPQTTVYIQSILPARSVAPRAIQSINNRLRELAKEESATYLDISSALSGPDGRLDPAYTNDGVHLMGTAYQRWKSTLIEMGAISN
jgi:lysophospholipase L1-like esterase